MNKKNYWSDPEFILSVLISLFFFSISMLIHYHAGLFATSKMSNPVSDLILDFLPAVDVSLIFVEGIILFWGLTALLLIKQPQKIPFVLKSLSLFMLIRSFFIILTHLGPHPDMISVPFNQIINKFTFEGDLFFSGHTGAPFLMALIFWKSRYLKWVFLIFSIIFGASVLLGHIHYSIDVFAAYFITFGIYHLSLKLFKKDHDLF